jgi:hypothetical protein
MVNWKPLALALLTASIVQLANANPAHNTEASIVEQPSIFEPVTSTTHALCHDVKEKLASYLPAARVSSNTAPFIMSLFIQESNFFFRASDDDSTGSQEAIG